MSGGVALLQRAIGYALGTVQAASPQLWSRPTPCRDWDLRMLLRHVCESTAALHEGLDAGHIGLAPSPYDDDTAADPTRAFRARAVSLRDRCTSAGSDSRVITVADCPLSDAVMAGVGALEIAVHGWDVSQACGEGRPIPPALAADLLTIAASLVPPTGRHPLFAEPVAVTEAAGPGERLVAYLGRAARA